MPVLLSHFCWLSCTSEQSFQIKQNYLYWFKLRRLVFVCFNGRGFEEDRNPQPQLLLNSWLGWQEGGATFQWHNALVGRHIYLLLMYWLETTLAALFSSLKMRKLQWQCWFKFVSSLWISSGNKLGLEFSCMSIPMLYEPWQNFNLQYFYSIKPSISVLILHLETWSSILISAVSLLWSQIASEGGEKSYT